MLKKTLALILLGTVLAGAAAAYTGGLPGAGGHDASRHSDRHHDGDDD